MEDTRDLVSKVGTFSGRDPPFTVDLLRLALLLCCYLFMVASHWVTKRLLENSKIQRVEKLYTCGHFNRAHIRAGSLLKLKMCYAFVNKKLEKQVSAS